MGFQMGCKGCTLAPWYFGFPQQQQWTQHNTIMKRNVAMKRMRMKKAPSSRELASGRPCSLVHTFSRISINSSLTSILKLWEEGTSEGLVGLYMWAVRARTGLWFECPQLRLTSVFGHQRRTCWWLSTSLLPGTQTLPFVFPPPVLVGVWVSRWWCSQAPLT